MSENELDIYSWIQGRIRYNKQDSETSELLRQLQYVL